MWKFKLASRFYFGLLIAIALVAPICLKWLMRFQVCVHVRSLLGIALIIRFVLSYTYVESLLPLQKAFLFLNLNSLY